MPVGRYAGGIEALAAVSDVGDDGRVVDLDVERRGVDPGVPGRVDQRLARRCDQLGQRVIEWRVADDDDLDRDGIGVLDLGGGGPDGVGQVADRVGVGRRVEHRPQGSLLPPGEPDDLPRRLGVALDQRERLQHRIVEVRGEGGALLAADALTSLFGQLRRHADPPRSGDQRDADERDGDGLEAVAQRREIGGRECRRAADHDQDCSYEHAGPAVAVVAGGAERGTRQLSPAGALGVARLTPQQRRAEAADRGAG